MDIWDKRRQNIRAMMAINRMTGTSVASEAGLSVNTLNKFLNGHTKSLKWDTLESVCAVIGVSNIAVLDSDNPFSDTKNQLYKLIDKMTDEEAKAELSRLIETE